MAASARRDAAGSSRGLLPNEDNKQVNQEPHSDQTRRWRRTSLHVFVAVILDDATAARYLSLSHLSGLQTIIYIQAPISQSIEIERLPFGKSIKKGIKNRSANGYADLFIVSCTE